MLVEVIEGYTREEIDSNFNKLYVFGDNCVYQGYGGQAKECRGLGNTFGIRTKFKPDNKPDAFFSDSLHCFELVKQDLDRLWNYLFTGYAIVLPKDGVGTGLAKLPEKAPKLHKYLEAQFLAMRYYGQTETSPRKSA